MEGYSRDDGLLDLIPKDGEWIRREEETSEEKKLELTLAPPRGEWREGLCLGPTPLLQNPFLRHTHNLHSSSYLQSGLAVNKESSQSCRIRPPAVFTSGTAQKRSAAAAVVGWPPVPSFRKNIASGSCSKLGSHSVDADVAPTKVSTSENGSFVKINMDGIPIGRKVDLKAYNSYEKLSLAVHDLFRGLVAAQKNEGLLDGWGIYSDL